MSKIVQTSYKCDRCECTYILNPNDLILFPGNWNRVSVSYPKKHDWEDLFIWDLCNECLSSLCDWINNKK